MDNQFVRTRRLERNLRSDEVFRRLREAERYAEVGEREQGFYLLEVKRRKLYRDRNCATFLEFVRNKTGIDEKKAADLLRVALALESLPVMDAAFAKGEIHWSAVRAMTRVATPQTEAHWVEFARTHLVNDVERRVAASRAG